MRAPSIIFSLLVGAAAGQTPTSGKVVVYAAVGPVLTQYDVDVAAATLTRRAAVSLPENVQYAWPHPSRRYLYVAWSNGSGADHHGVTALRIETKSGALSPYGDPLPLPARPIHVSTDIIGTHLLVAYNEPSGVTVHNLEPDGAIGSEVKQAGLDTGIYAHQVRVEPSNRTVILVTRGNGPTANKPEDPGALKVFRYQQGLLANQASIAPGGGFGFQPRHLDFDPSGRWVFVSLERQNKLQVYRMLPDGGLNGEPLFVKESLTDPQHAAQGQEAGTVHVHPNGKYLYQANRASGATGPVASGEGENSIAVYSVNPRTGEPIRIQNIDTRGMTPRTFALDAGGRILIVANQNAAKAPRGQTVPASLAVFRVRDDGKLDFVRKYDVETSASRTMFWMGVVSLP